MKKYDYTGIVAKAAMEKDARIEGLKGAGRWFGMAALAEAVIGAVMYVAAAAVAMTTALVSLPAIVIGSVIAAIGLGLSTWFGFYKNKKQTLQAAKANNDVVTLIDTQKATLKAFETEAALTDAYSALQKPESEFFKTLKAKGANPLALIEKQLKPVFEARGLELGEAAKREREEAAKREETAKRERAEAAKREATAKREREEAAKREGEEAAKREGEEAAKREGEEAAERAKEALELHNKLLAVTTEHAALYQSAVRDAVNGVPATEHEESAEASGTEELQPDAGTIAQKRSPSLVRLAKGTGNLLRLREKGSSKRVAPITPAQDLAQQSADEETRDPQAALDLNVTQKDDKRPTNTVQ